LSQHAVARHYDQQLRREDWAEHKGNPPVLATPSEKETLRFFAFRSCSQEKCLPSQRYGPAIDQLLPASYPQGADAEGIKAECDNLNLQMYLFNIKI